MRTGITEERQPRADIALAASLGSTTLPAWEHFSELQDTPEVRGMINKISYLVKVL